MEEKITVVNPWSGEVEQYTYGFVASKIRYFLGYYGLELAAIMKSVGERSYQFFRAINTEE